MAEQKSFKIRVKDTVQQYALLYKEYFVNYEYLVCSKAFVHNPHYIVSAREDNYLHLTGLHTSLSAQEFFNRCYNGTLTENDFDFIKSGQSEDEVKGSVRRKINSLPHMMTMFVEGTLVQENFIKNRISCTFATANLKATLGFVVEGKARPKTLLKGYELNSSKVQTLDLVLRRKVGEMHFCEVIVGDTSKLNEYKVNIKDLVDTSLFE